MPRRFSKILTRNREHVKIHCNYMENPLYFAIHNFDDQTINCYGLRFSQQF